MSIAFRILGTPDGDNGLFVQIDAGHTLERLLFDCGEQCVADLSFAEIQATDHLFFSHFHMDHVAGFDHFFRCTFDRTTKPNRIWGPPDTARIVQHRFQGFLWNLHESLAATWHVADVGLQEIRTTRFELLEAFAVAHDEGAQPYRPVIVSGMGYTVEAVTMDHRAPTLAYIVRETARRNIDVSRLEALGLPTGPWLKHLKDDPQSRASIDVDGVTYATDALLQALIVETPGDSIAYLTDFLLDEAAMERLTAALAGCRTIVCESQYRAADLELARKNYHMTSTGAATLAKRAGAAELVLFHLSDRYERDQWLEMLDEARAIFPNARYPEQWGLEPAI